MPTLYATVPREKADEIAHTLVEERLAACVNRIDCASTYRWEGSVEDDAETILLAKTTAEGYDALADRLEALHPYEVPCIERFDEDEVLDAFADWRASAVK